MNRLCSGAESCLHTISLSQNDAEAVRTCISKYELPDTFCKKLEWLVYRVIQAFKSLFGCSDWQMAARIIQNNYTQEALRARVIQEIPQNSLEELIKDKAISSFSWMSSRILDLTLLLQEERTEASAELRNRLRFASINEILSAIRRIREEALSTFPQFRTV